VPLKLKDLIESVQLLAWAKENSCPWRARTCAFAAKYGQLEALQWARVDHCPWDELTCAFAPRYGRLDVLRWAREHGCPWWQGGMCAHVARYGQLACDSGCGSRAARGMRGRVHAPLSLGT
jgi:hypothetical protein